jgi:hypothetical protein
MTKGFFSKLQNMVQSVTFFKGMNESNNVIKLEKVLECLAFAFN